MSFDSLYCISTRAARGGEGCLGGWRDVDPGDGAILGGEGGDGGKKGGRATECSHHTRASKQEF